MSQLTWLLEKLKDSGAERVFFAPNDLGYSLTGDVKKPLPGGAVTAATILEAVSELLSEDDILGLSNARPRILRHELDGEEFVLEVTRQSGGVALGIRPAQKSARLRDSVRRDEPRLRDSVKRDEPVEPPPKPQVAAAANRSVHQQDTARFLRPSRRMRAPHMHQDKRTVRAIMDDDGNLIDPGDVLPEVDLDRAKAGPETPRVAPRVDPEPPPREAARQPEAPRAARRSEPETIDRPVGQTVIAIAQSAAPQAPPHDTVPGQAQALVKEAVRELIGAARQAAVEAVREIQEAAAKREAAAMASEHVVLDEPKSTKRAGNVAPPPRDGEPVQRPSGAPKLAGPARVDALLREMMQRKASDLHLTANAPPVFRVDGAIHFSADRSPLTSSDIFEMVAEIMTGRARAEYEATHDADFAHEIPGAARFRVNVFRDRHGTGAVFRRIPIEIVPADKLGLPKACLDLCWLSKGLVLVTGPTGSGKSTTLAAMIDFINKNRSDHIITIEDPVEFVHQNQKCLVNQREVGQHTRSFKNALRAALREDPDIVLVGELRDLETIAIAIETAETGHLVFGTLHTTTAISTVDRIIDQFPADQQDQIRVMLSESLKGVIAQVLLPKIGGGRVAAHEVLLGNHAVAALIREGKTFQIASVMQTQKGAGMMTMNDCLFGLVQKKLVDPKEAYLKAVDKSGFAGLLRSAGITPPV